MTQCEALDSILGLFIETFGKKKPWGCYTLKRGWELLLVDLSLGSNALPWLKADPAKQAARENRNFLITYCEHLASAMPKTPLNFSFVRSSDFLWKVK